MSNDYVSEIVAYSFSNGINQLVDTYLSTNNLLFLEIAESFCMNNDAVDFKILDGGNDGI